MLNQAQKESIIRDIHTFGPGLVAWDIHELTFADKRKWTAGVIGEDVAEGTLTFNGRVFPTAEVNYLLWGLINRLVFNDGIETDRTNLRGITDKVVGYRMIFGGVLWANEWYQGRDELNHFETMSGKVDWTVFGWNWATNPNQSLFPPDGSALPNAKPNRDKWMKPITFRAGLAGHIDGIVRASVH